jgi:hypothetical protein
VSLPDSKVHSYTKAESSKKKDREINYGPYKGVAPFTLRELRVHYENHTPFIKVSGCGTSDLFMHHRCKHC